MFHAQRNSWVHLFLLLTICVGGFCNFSVTEWCFVLLVSSVVITAEAVNMAVEMLVDAMHPDHHPGMGKSKDLVVVAVPVVAIAAFSVGLIVFVPKLLSWILPS